MLNKKPKAEAFGFCSYIFIFLPEAINANDESANSIAAIVITEASPVGGMGLGASGLGVGVGVGVGV
ncbi:MAG: hypothetical protein IKC10_08265, partial [Alphaproteobacteria bacterium]|nr:hypothetical protein [Alphaproteobacteria bacterium]